MTDETRVAMCKLLAWDLAQLESGTWDVVDYAGAFHPLNSAREKLGGEQMPAKAVSWTEGSLAFTACFVFLF